MTAPQPARETPRRVAVVGSGVAGLTAAHVIAKSAEVVLIEADERLVVVRPALEAVKQTAIYQGAFLTPGPGDPYLYSFGTPAGRGGAAYMSRVLPQSVPDLRRYEYWSSASNSWVPGNPAAATPDETPVRAARVLCGADSSGLLPNAE